MSVKKQNEINDVAIKKLSAQNLENLFYVFQRDNGQYFYNVLKTVNFPEDIDPTLYSQYETKPKDHIRRRFIHSTFQESFKEQ